MNENMWFFCILDAIYMDTNGANSWTEMHTIKCVIMATVVV